MNYEKHALILIDLQNDYFPGGNMMLFGMDRIARNAGALLTQWRQKQRPVIHIQHISVRPGATFFLPDTEGAEIYPDLTPVEGETVITKHYPNSFRETDLGGVLKKLDIRQLLVCGAMSHMCVDATVRAAWDQGYECVVAEDACATMNLEFNGKPVLAGSVHAAFMAALGSVYATIIRTKDGLQ